MMRLLIPFTLFIFLSAEENTQSNPDLQQQTDVMYTLALHTANH